MFKGDKPTKKPRKPGGGAALMQQMGYQMPNFDGSGMGGDDDDDDDDLEAELRRLQLDMGGNPRSKANQQKGGGAQDLQGFHRDVNKLLHDIDKPINDDDLSDVDEDELLAELNEITDEIQNEQHDQPKSTQKSSSGNIMSLLEGRQDMYVKAISAAKASGDASKSRRLERQLKTIQDLLQSARSGAIVEENEIPPEVFIASQPTPAAPQAPTRAPLPPSAPEQKPASHPRAVPLPQLQQPAAPVRVKENTVKPQPQVPPPSIDSDPAVARLKALALQAKRNGDMAKAKEYIIQLKALQEKSAGPPAASRPIQKETYDNVPNTNEDDDDDTPPPPMPLKAPEPRTIMEALQQRYDELTKRGEEAASKGDSSKARRMERLAKQYEEAINATRKGQPYNYNELPELPGFAPIPLPQSKPQPTSSAAVGATKPAASTGQTRPTQHQQQTVLAPTSTSSTSARKSQQAQTLRLKQEKFHKLAVQAKQQGDIATAKKFLVAYKGLEQMIEAAESGLPIDMSQVPKLPDDDNNLINDDDLTADLAHADRDTVYRRLQDDLLRQIQTCAKNQQTYKQMDTIDSERHVNEYKRLEQRCANDLEKLRQCFQHGLKPPLFHYERRQMTVVQTNSDLGENDLEVTVLRGINLPVPLGHSSPSLETYVTIEFPYPTDTPQTARTRHAAGSTNAEYSESTHKFYIKRNDAKFRRLMSRKELKLGVFYKPGFLRSDRPLGIASIKLTTLEQSCTIHESVDLFESEHRKKIEGKLEVKLRIREALGQTRASDILPQRWLVIDRFEESSPSKKPSSTSNRTNPAEMTDHQRRRSHQNPKPTVAASTFPQSIQVLNYEASFIQQQIEKLHDRLSPDELHQLEMKLQTIQRQSDQIVESLRRGGRQAVEDHLHGLYQLVDHYDQEAREYHQRHENKKVDMNLTKKKLVLKEIDTLGGPSSSTKF